MPSGSKRSAGLAKLFHAVQQPVYLLDADQCLVFCNDECANWLGSLAGELEGRRCVYSSSPGLIGPDAAAARLCPPPQALAGEITWGIIARSLPDGQVRRHRARFFPLGLPPAAVLALVEPDDLAEMPPANPSLDGAEAAQLHERLREYSRQAVAQHGQQRLIGESPAMRRVRAQVAAAAAACDASVSIVGPRGSGRQYVAEAIHAAGPAESSGLFVPLSCDILTTELTLSTLGALTRRMTSADRTVQGTLFLAEVDALAAEAQQQLLSFICSRQIPFRLASSSRSTLNDAARRGEFRPELAVLLDTLVIQMPAMEERREDLPILAQGFLEDLNARGTKQVAGFTPEALDVLAAYAWPGQVTELAATVAEAHRHAEGPLAGVHDLPERIHLSAAAMARPRKREETLILDDFLIEVERELITRALARAKGNKARAARHLGMTRPRLYRRMVRLGLLKED